MGRILVVGSSNTDMVVKSPRFPTPGETIIGGEFYMFPGGKGANQAVAAARLGGRVTLVARVGDDDFGKSAIDNYNKEHIRTEYITIDPSSPSGVALINLNLKGENQIVVASGANENLSRENIDRAKSSIMESDIVLAQLEVPIDTVEYLIDITQQLNKKMILNPAPAQHISSAALERIFLITPNETEVELLTGIKVTSLDDADRAATFLLRKGVDNIIITLGKSGSFYKSESEMFFIKANRVKAIDTTAAGDIYNGALAVALAQNQTWRESITFATRAAGISVTRLGAQASAPYLKELE